MKCCALLWWIQTVAVDAGSTSRTCSFSTSCSTSCLSRAAMVSFNARATLLVSSCNACMLSSRRFELPAQHQNSTTRNELLVTYACCAVGAAAARALLVLLVCRLIVHVPAGTQPCKY